MNVFDQQIQLFTSIASVLHVYILINILKDGKEKLHVQLTGARRLYTCPTFDASSFTDLSWFTRACSRL